MYRLSGFPCLRDKESSHEQRTDRHDNIHNIRGCIEIPHEGEMKDNGSDHSKNVDRSYQIRKLTPPVSFQIHLQIKQDGDHQTILQQHYDGHADGRVLDPKVQIATDPLTDHIESPDEAEGSEGQITIIHLSKDKAGNGEQEQAEEAHQCKQHHRR